MRISQKMRHLLPAVGALGVSLALLYLTWGTSLGTFLLPAFQQPLTHLTKEKLYRAYATNRRVDLRGADLSQQSFHLVHFHLSQLTGTKLDGARFEGTHFLNTQLSGSSWREAKLYNAVFQASNLRKANFSGAELYSCSFLESDLRGANLRGAKMHNCLIYASRLGEAIFDHATTLPFAKEEALARGMRYAGQD